MPFLIDAYVVFFILFLFLFWVLYFHFENIMALYLEIKNTFFQFWIQGYFSQVAK